jgi:hypothetical protein
VGVWGEMGRRVAHRNTSSAAFQLHGLLVHHYVASLDSSFVCDRLLHSPSMATWSYSTRPVPLLRLLPHRQHVWRVSGVRDGGQFKPCRGQRWRINRARRVGAVSAWTVFDPYHYSLELQTAPEAFTSPSTRPVERTHPRREPSSSSRRAARPLCL